MKPLLIIILTLSTNIGLSQFNSVVDFSYDKIDGEFSPLLSLDIYTPNTGDNLPVMVFIHGGGWQAGDKASESHINKRDFFINNGFVFVSINYRLAPNDFYPVYPQDVANSIAFVLNWIGKFKGNNQKVFLMGHSSGAHLAALVTTDNRYLNSYNYNPSDIKGVILLDGAGYDIPATIAYHIEHNNTSGINLYHTAFGIEQNTWQHASPINYTNHVVPPFQIFYVDTREISDLASHALASSLISFGNIAQAIGVSDSSHAEINNGFGIQGDVVSVQTLDFINSLLD